MKVRVQIQGRSEAMLHHERSVTHLGQSVLVADFPEECLQMLGHYLVKDGLFGLMALVCSRGAMARARGSRRLLGTDRI